VKPAPVILAVAALSALTAASPLAGQGTRFTAVEELRIGSDDPAREGLSRVPAIAVGPRGSIFIAQPLSHSVWVFDQRGRRLADVGRRGGGPGEFEWPNDVGWRADSLWVLDLSRVKFTIFDAALSPRVSVQVGPALYPTGLLADGSVLVYDRPGDMEIGTRRVTSSAHQRVSRGGRRLGTVARFDWAHFGMYIRRPGSDLPNTYRPQPFSDTPLLDVASDGRAIVIVDRPAAAAARGEFVVRRLNASGGTLWTSRVRYAAHPVTDAMVADSVAARAALITSIPEFGATRATAERWIRQALYRPRNLPPVTAVVAGRDGTTWLKREAVQRGWVSWLVLGARGEQVGNVRMPAGLQVMEADRHNAWGVVLDDDYVPFVVRYGVRPRGP
jgi:hypothetical protein